MDLAPCQEPVQTAEDVFLPCVRESGHVGEHSPGRCERETKGEGTGVFTARRCTLPRGHAGSCWSWVEEADAEREYEPLAPLRDESGFGVRRW